MAKRKDVTIEVPTAHLRIKTFPPSIITTKNFWRWNWKYIGLTWASIAVIAVIGCFLPRPICLVFSTVLAFIPFFLGIRAITRHTVKEISS
jgi:hypothetical protein